MVEVISVPCLVCGQEFKAVAEHQAPCVFEDIHADMDNPCPVCQGTGVMTAVPDSICSDACFDKLNVEALALLKNVPAWLVVD